ncbi:LolA family protein [Chryseolinea soli]|nr:outer membrane lipoprotein carrier protein LolA [Chryseolinea soli]
MRDIRTTIFFKTLGLLMSIGLLISHPAKAQYTGFKPVADLAAFKKQFATESAKVSTITSNFTQVKTLTALTETITSTGKFWFQRSNRVRIDYQKPFHYLIVMNGDKMLVKNDQKENRINVKSNKLFQQVNRIMIDCVQGTILDSKDFTTKVFENDKGYLLEMTPTSKALKEFFQTIVLQVEKKDYTARSIEMNEPSGDKTVISFTDKTLNTTLSDALFSL